MKKLSCELLAILLSIPAFAQTPHFRKVRWGYTPKEVMATEVKKPTFVSDFTVTYDSVLVADYNVRVSYNFDAKRLSSASYNTKATPSDSAKIRDVFAALLSEATHTNKLHQLTADETGQPATLVFQSEDNKAIFYFGRLKNSDFRLEVFYTKPTSRTRAAQN